MSGHTIKRRGPFQASSDGPKRPRSQASSSDRQESPNRREKQVSPEYSYPTLATSTRSLPIIQVRPHAISAVCSYESFQDKLVKQHLFRKSRGTGRIDASAQLCKTTCSKQTVVHETRALLCLPLVPVPRRPVNMKQLSRICCLIPLRREATSGMDDLIFSLFPSTSKAESEDEAIALTEDAAQYVWDGRQ